MTFLILRLDGKIEIDLVRSCVIMLALFRLFTHAGQALFGSRSFAHIKKKMT